MTPKAEREFDRQCGNALLWLFVLACLALAGALALLAEVAP